MTGVARPAPGGASHEQAIPQWPEVIERECAFVRKRAVVALLTVATVPAVPGRREAA